MATFSDNTLNLIKESLSQREAGRFTARACLNSQGIRRSHEEQLQGGYRQAFSIDADRILHSLAYTRYIDKTQVFYLLKNDHITHRVLHVQLVSKIARTIGHFLGLNEDLIEAIALGHDIGHAPFGHDGEKPLPWGMISGMRPLDMMANIFCQNYAVNMRLVFFNIMFKVSNSWTG
jgi:dGTP triphosphohydrolase